MRLQVLCVNSYFSPISVFNPSLQQFEADQQSSFWTRSITDKQEFVQTTCPSLIEPGTPDSVLPAGTRSSQCASQLHPQKFQAQGVKRLLAMGHHRSCPWVLRSPPSHDRQGHLNRCWLGCVDIHSQAFVPRPYRLRCQDLNYTYITQFYLQVAWINH